MNQIEASFSERERSTNLYQAVLAAIVDRDGASVRTIDDIRSDESTSTSVLTETPRKDTTDRTNDTQFRQTLRKARSSLTRNGRATKR